MFQEENGGVIEHLFHLLAVKKTKNGSPLWDKMLDDGQNWEMGFMHGLQQSQVIVFLMSNTV